ncbi:hypothetical protein [Mammaliicoccus sciuri]|uniref:hypothetical protein n=1 Tax=Mammaliicoccus sciuri TaxID=1296 RepID=UPI002DBDC048|nr:hypothetical protein [Mammaliicoccus sciuri]MEB6231420.1 hypothetical protein [Mammaliicoccus sciuri]
MPTIKTKKEMNLGELLCWAIDNREQARFRDFKSKSMRVRFNDSAKPEIIFAKRFLPIEQTFKVEIEEPITEDTVIPEIIGILRSKYSNSKVSMMHNDKSVNEIIKGNNSNGLDYETLTLHVINDDDTLTLIWTKEKGLVE